MAECEEYSSWVEVDLGQITKNVAWFHRFSEASVMAGVKAKGYGHGATPVARARESGIQARLHLKVDSGMSRLGIQPGEALNLAKELVLAPKIIFEGVFTHFARADELDQDTNEIQERKFQEIVDGLTGM